MTNQPLDSSGIPEEFWFNLKTGQVEFGKLAPATYRVGPFSTAKDAARALETLSSRSKKWDDDEED